MKSLLYSRERRSWTMPHDVGRQKFPAVGAELMVLWDHVLIAVLAAANLALGGQPMVRQFDVRLAQQEVARATGDVHRVEIGRLQAVLLIHRHAPVLLAAGPAKDQGEGGALATLGGADGADALPAVVEMGAGGIEAGGDGPALGEEGVQLGDGMLRAAGNRRLLGVLRDRFGQERSLDVGGVHLEFPGQLENGPGSALQGLGDRAGEGWQIVGQGLVGLGDHVVR